MLKIFYKISLIVRTLLTEKGVAEGWRRDPLIHPAVTRMSLREVGDLPLDPRDTSSW
ncbi:hypothetical protein [Ciceribacter sp. L1K22]|uniref:hypothetical protein n=1 Tax=Ciceribacter sp. L1K22 TaxID=2820275 RepID=UPI001ABE903E|nr:hypothetical protein [Ciceribacter sp. L1K22]MBO3758797.1 hypothetical protein [Ciceribacter sp. L1K22]